MKIVEVKTRTCKKCNETKPLDEFRQNLSCLYGREPVCKVCKNKAAKLKRTKAKASDFVERAAKKASAMVDATIKAVKQEQEAASLPPIKGTLFNLKRPNTKDSFKIVLVDEPTPTGNWLAARCNELLNTIYARITSGRYDEKLESWAQELARTIKARNEFERVEASEINQSSQNGNRYKGVRNGKRINFREARIFRGREKEDCSTTGPGCQR